MSQELKALHHSAAAQHPSVASSPPTQRLPVLALHPKTPRVGGCPLTHHTHPSKIFSAGPTPPPPSFQHPFPPPPAGEGSRDAGMQESPLPADLAEPRCIPTLRSIDPPPAPKCMWGAGIDTPDAPKCPRQRSKSTLGSARTHSNKVLPCWFPGTQRLGGPGGWRGGDSSHFSMFPAQRSPDQTLRSTGRWERGAPGSGLGWREPLCYHHYCLSFGEGGKR